MYIHSIDYMCACMYLFSTLQLTCAILWSIFIHSTSSLVLWLVTCIPEHLLIVSMMADHVGGGSTCFSHSFNISLKHRFEL